MDLDDRRANYKIMLCEEAPSSRARCRVCSKGVMIGTGISAVDAAECALIMLRTECKMRNSMDFIDEHQLCRLRYRSRRVIGEDYES